MEPTHGMNPDEVERLGRELQSAGQRLDAMVRDISTWVHTSTWEGEDATRFKHEWWPGHLVRLQSVASGIDGFGQSALNNAEAQRRASGADTGTTPDFSPCVLPTGSTTIPIGLLNDWRGMLGPLASTLGEVKDLGGAKALGSAFGGIDAFVQGYGIGGHVAEGEWTDAGLDSLFFSGDRVADFLKTKGGVGYGAGVALQTWVEVGRESMNVDWSAEGMEQIFTASLSDWGGAFADAVPEFGKKLPSLFGW